MEENKNKLIINIVKTDSVCFISDCNKTTGYDYDYHNTRLSKLYFDGKLPEKSYCKNWFQVEKYPEKIQKKVSGERINIRYEIIDKEMISKKLPEVIEYENSNNYSDEILDNLYTYKYDTLPDRLETVEVEFNEVLVVNDFKVPVLIDYKAVHKWDYSDKPYQITNANVQHQLLDKMIFPEIMLHSRPCSFSSKQVYDITRQYIKDNIDTSKAKITSDYDFCFTVKKIIPLLEPKTVSYQNIFARTKKERNKINYATHTYKEIEIFEMTHDQSKYSNYTVIKPIYGENDEDLKNKMDEWLDSLIKIINKPLELCPHCNGTGYKDDIENLKSK